MELEEAKKILLNCYPMKTTHVLDDTNKANKEAIEVVLKIINEATELIKDRCEVKHGECTFGLCDYECSHLLLVLEGVATDDFE